MLWDSFFPTIQVSVQGVRETFHWNLRWVIAWNCLVEFTCQNFSSYNHKGFRTIMSKIKWFLVFNVKLNANVKRFNFTGQLSMNAELEIGKLGKSHWH